MDVLVGKVEDAERMSWASALGKDVRERIWSSAVHVLHVVSRLCAACLISTVSTTA